MAKIIPYVFFQELDNNGDPLAGGKVYTYEAGTSTPKTTYTTQDEATPNANPVILDSNGRADIWLDSGAYKFVITDSADVTIKTVDNVTGEAANVFGSSVVQLSTNTNITTTYKNNVIECTAAITLSLLDVATAEEGFVFTVKNSSAGNVTIDPDSSEQIDGASTKTVLPDSSVIVVCTGTAWLTFAEGATFNELVDDTTPQLGGNLDVNGNSIVSTSNGNIDLTPNGTGNVSLGNFTFDADQTVGAGQDNYVLTYDNAGGLISLKVTATVSQAAQSAIEAETDEDSYVPPDKMRYSPSTAACWVDFQLDGTINADYNVTSIADNGTLDFTITIDEDLGDTNYTVFGNGYSGGALANDRVLFRENPAVGSFDLINPGDNETNVAGIHCLVFGNF